MKSQIFSWLLGAAKKLPKWALIGGGAVAGGAAVVGGTQAGGAMLKDVAKTPVEGSAEIVSAGGVQQTKSNFFGIMMFLAEILKSLGVGGGIPETIAKWANRGHMLGGGNPLHDKNRWAADDQRFGGPGLGQDYTGSDTNTSITDATWGKVANGAWEVAKYGVPAAAVIGGGIYGYKHYMAPKATGVAGGAADVVTDGAKAASATATTATKAAEAAAGGSKIEVTNEYGRTRATRAAEAEVAAAKTAGAADEAARGGSKIMNALRKIPRIGKLFGVGAVAGGAAMLSSEDAEAAPALKTTPSTVSGGATVAAGVGPLHAAAAEIGGVGLSIVGARAAAGVVASGVAAVVPSVATAIPGVASIYAAGETLYNVGSNALKGEWKKAGLNLVSGIGETVAGIGGAATYLTVGTAWREAVRYGGAKLLGEENTIEHATTVQAASWLKDKFSSAASGPANAPSAAQPLIYKDKGPAFAF